MKTDRPAEGGAAVSPESFNHFFFFFVKDNCLLERRVQNTRNGLRERLVRKLITYIEMFAGNMTWHGKVYALQQSTTVITIQQMNRITENPTLSNGPPGYPLLPTTQSILNGSITDFPAVTADLDTKFKRSANVDNMFQVTISEGVSQEHVKRAAERGKQTTKSSRRRHH